MTATVEFYQKISGLSDLTLVEDIVRASSVLHRLQDRSGQRYVGKSLREPLPKDDEDFVRGALLNELAGLRFLNGVKDVRGVVPDLVAGSAKDYAVLMKDLGPSQSGDELFKSVERTEAGRALTHLMITLAQMHGSTLGREAEYRALRSPLGFDDPKDGGIRTSIQGYTEFVQSVSTQLGLAVATGWESEIEAVVRGIFEPGPLTGYVHWDPCPDNFLWDGSNLRLFDFEKGSFANVFVDAVFPRMRFPSCWCVGQIPAGIIESLENIYRSELLRYQPRLQDDSFYILAHSTACLFWYLRVAEEPFTGALQQDRVWGLCTVRQRLLVRGQVVAETLEASGLYPRMASFIRTVTETLRMRWGHEVLPMPLYPAFQD